MSKSAKIFWVGLAVAIIGIGVYLRLWYPFEEVERSVGKFRTRDAAVVASIQKLSQEMQRRPATQKYIIWFWRGEPDGTGGGGATMYERRYKQFGWAADPTSGWIDSWTNIDDSTIHAIAATNGSFASLGKPSM